MGQNICARYMVNVYGQRKQGTYTGNTKGNTYRLHIRPTCKYNIWENIYVLLIWVTCTVNTCRQYTFEHTLPTNTTKTCCIYGQHVRITYMSNVLEQGVWATYTGNLYQQLIEAVVCKATSWLFCIAKQRRIDRD